jgi:hypothetical protein
MRTYETKQIRCIQRYAEWEAAHQNGVEFV